MSYKKLLVITLWLIALHSIGVGIGMILFPTDWIAYFDITPSEHRFLITQGGVFHIIMAIAYNDTIALILLRIVFRFNTNIAATKKWK